MEAYQSVRDKIGIGGVILGGTTIISLIVTLILWIIYHSVVFFAGANIAAISLVLAQLIPDKPQKDLVTRRIYSTTS